MLVFILASVFAGLCVLTVGGAPRALAWYLGCMLGSVAVLALITGWPRPARLGCPTGYRAAHSRAVLSALAVASSLPFGANATEFTALACPVRVPVTRPVAMSQSRTVPS